jgi:hypothetical protein
MIHREIRRQNVLGDITQTDRRHRRETAAWSGKVARSAVLSKRRLVWPAQDHVSGYLTRHADKLRVFTSS